MAGRRLAVLGHPVAHSRSPAMQNAALAELGLAPEWAYEAIDVVPERFAEQVREMPAEGFVGANVTVPHKVAALELADEASAAAREIGAANTLSFIGGGIVAENTDAEGIVAAINAGGPIPEAARALVLGAGGAARAAIWALVREGVEVAVWNRTAERARSLAAELGARAVERPDSASFDLVVNATSIGLPSAAGGAGSALKALPVDADAIGERQTVVDLAYGPAETELVRLARERGAKVVDGLEVLVHQGAASLRIWTGREPPIEAMRRAARSTDAPRQPT